MIHTVLVAASLVAMVLSPCVLAMSALPAKAMRALLAFPNTRLEIGEGKLFEC